MKGYRLTAPFTLSEQEIVENNQGLSTSKVRLTRALITYSDVLRFRGELDCKNLCLGSSGVGIVSDAEPNLFDLEQGSKVYVQSIRLNPNAINGKKTNNKYSNLVAGENFDGFLRDFISVDSGNLFLLPKSVSENDALYIDHISTAIEIIDELDIQKGDYVAVLGANNFAVILSQLLMYHQAVPIIVSSNVEDEKFAKNCGIYYALSDEENWLNDINTLTSGRLCDKVIYISDCNIPISKAFSLASYNAAVALTGLNNKTTPVSFNTAIKKQLSIMCINNSYGNTTTSINLLANKVFDLSNLRKKAIHSKDIIKTFNELSENYVKGGSVTETIVDLLY